MSSKDMQGEYTGRLLLVGKPKNAKSTIASIKAETGLSVASSRDFKDQSVGVEALSEGDRVYFDEIGITVITPKEDDHFSKLSMAKSLSIAEEDFPILEPERIVYAIDENFGDYLRGFRDAVNAVSDKYGNVTEAPAMEDLATTLANGSTWGLQVTKTVVGFPFSQTRSGSGIKVAVLDTGFDLNHPDFAGRTIVSQSFVPGEAVRTGTATAPTASALPAAHWSQRTKAANAMASPMRPTSMPERSSATPAAAQMDGFSAASIGQLHKDVR